MTGDETAVPAAARSRQLASCSDNEPDFRRRRPRPPAQLTGLPLPEPPVQAHFRKLDSCALSVALVTRGAGAERGAGRERGVLRPAFPLVPEKRYSSWPGSCSSPT